MKAENEYSSLPTYIESFNDEIWNKNYINNIINFFMKYFLFLILFIFCIINGQEIKITIEKGTPHIEE